MSYVVRRIAGTGLAVALLALSLAAPARAEFFGCSNGGSHVVTTSSGLHGWRAQSRYRHRAAPPVHHVTRARVVYEGGWHREPRRTNW